MKKMTKYRSPFSSRRNSRRGSTILLVIAILSMLVLLAILLTFTSRIEMSSSNNAAFGTQNRVASRTGAAPVSLTLLSNLAPGPVSTIDLSFNQQAFQAANNSSAPVYTAGLSGRVQPTNDSSGQSNNLLSQPYGTAGQLVVGNPDLYPLVVTNTAQVAIQDVAGLININTASEQVLEQFFSVAASELNLSLSPAQLARAVVAIRLGPDGAPGFAGVDDDFDAPLAINPTADSDALLKSELSARGSYNQSGSGSLEYFEAFSKTRQSEVQEQLTKTIDPLGNYQAGELKARQQLRLAVSTGVDEPDEFIGDFRRMPYGDDFRFSSLEELLTFSSLTSAGLDESTLLALSPMMTLFSATEEQLVVGDTLESLVNLNRASAEEIYDGLKRLYGSSKNDSLLKQFAVNVIDARDTDSVPTVYPGTTGRNAIVGLERTPFITEVYADARTPEEGGDDGQFVEIYNPWSEALSVQGWRLRAGSSDILLSGAIPPNGYLIVTDDANGEDDPKSSEDLSGTGSLYQIFGVVPNGGNRRVVQNPQFSLTNRGSNITVELYNDDTQLADSFSYNGLREDEDSLYSYQRENPAIRTALRQTATPFALPRVSQPDSELLARLAVSPMNGPFVNEADVLTVFSGFSAPQSASGSGQSTSAGQLWAFPVLGTPNSSDASIAALASRSDLLDARLLDVFALFEREQQSAEATTGSGKNDSRHKNNSTSSEAKKSERQPSRNAQAEEVLKEGLQSFESRMKTPAYAEAAASLLDEEAYERFTLNESVQPVPAISHARINVNTAPMLVLASLPGVTTAQAEQLSRKRTLQEEAFRLGERGASAHLFSRQSDLLIDDILFPRELSYQQRLDQLRLLLPNVAFNSRSFRIVSQPRADDAELDEAQRAANRVQALVATDRELPEILRMTSVKP